MDAPPVSPTMEPRRWGPGDGRIGRGRGRSVGPGGGPFGAERGSVGVGPVGSGSEKGWSVSKFYHYYHKIFFLNGRNTIGEFASRMSTLPLRNDGCIGSVCWTDASHRLKFHPHTHTYKTHTHTHKKEREREKIKRERKFRVLWNKTCADGFNESERTGSAINWIGPQSRSQQYSWILQAN